MWQKRTVSVKEEWGKIQAWQYDLKDRGIWGTDSVS